MRLVFQGDALLAVTLAANLKRHARLSLHGYAVLAWLGFQVQSDYRFPTLISILNHQHTVAIEVHHRR